MGIARDLAKAFKEHDCFSLAANISFFAVLSLIPLLMITMSVAGYVLGGSQDLFNQIVLAITDVLPQGRDELIANLKHIVAGRSQVGGFGILILLFIASLLFTSVEHALDRIFQSVKKRNFFHSRLLSVLIMFGAISLLFLPTIFGVFQSFLYKFNITIPLTSLVTSKFFFVGMMVVIFTLAVVTIPNHDVKFKYALIGGVFFAVGLGLAKFLFRFYVLHAFDRYNLIYGSLTVLVVSIIWLYYIANILLLASELVAVLQRRYNGNDKIQNSNVK